MPTGATSVVAKTLETGEVTSIELSSKLAEVAPSVLPIDSSLDDLESSLKLEVFDILTENRE